MSAATLQDLANWLQPMLAALQPAARRTLAGQIARELRRQNQATCARKPRPTASHGRRAASASWAAAARAAGPNAHASAPAP